MTPFDPNPELLPTVEQLRGLLKTALQRVVSTSVAQCRLRNRAPWLGLTPAESVVNVQFGQIQLRITASNGNVHVAAFTVIDTRTRGKREPDGTTLDHMTAFIVSETGADPARIWALMQELQRLQLQVEDGTAQIAQAISDWMTENAEGLEELQAMLVTEGLKK